MRALQLIYLLALGLFAAPTLLAQNTITTVAGGGNPSGLATDADIVTPSGVAVDSQGNVYIGQFLGSQVFKVNPQGIIAVFAGQNFFGGTGDGGPALHALFHQTIRVAVDSGGNVFIADFANSRIRRVDAHTGIIATVAGNGSTCPDRTQSCGDGGAATQATLTLPEAVAIDSAGDLFIADRFDHRIRRVDASTRIITTVAGNGTQCISGPCGDGGPATQANLNNPRGIAVDPSGNLFIGEGGRIRRVDAASHIITTLVTPPDGANYIIVEPSGTLLVSGGLSVYRVNVSTAAVTSLAGAGTSCVGLDSGDGGPATAACLGRPFSVAEDSTGVIYVGQSASNRVRKIDASAQHIITTFAGGGSGGDGGPATSAILGFPSGGALDSEGNGYINDAANNRIRRVDGSTNTITTAAGSGAPNAGIPGTSGDGGPAVNANLSLNLNTGGTVVDPSGNIFLSDVNSDAVRRVDAVTGVITSFAGGTPCTDSTTPCGDGGAATSAALNFPGGLALDQNRNLFIADTDDSRVRRVAASTGIISTVAGNGTSCPNSTTACGDGGPATAANLGGPGSVALDSSGNLFIADTNDFRVRRVDALTGIITTIAGNGTPCTSLVTPCGDGGLATVAELYFPEGITVDGSGNVFIGDSNLVRRVDAATKTITSIAGSLAGTFSGDGGPASAAGIGLAGGLWVDAAGNLFIADAENNRIRLVSLSPTATITGAIANFGSQIVGVHSPAHTVTITNTGAATLLIESITVSGTGFSSTNTCTNTNNQLAPSQSCTASVTFTAPSVGQFAGTLTISTNGPTSGSGTFSFGGNGSTSALASIAVTPANPSAIVAVPTQFSATATYADASTQDLTDSAVWTTANSAIATITNAGLATGVAPGTTAVGASSGSISASTNLTVTAPTELGISITPPAPFLAIGQTQQFTATAIFNNGSEQNVTSTVTWTSASPANASITSTGLATAAALGTATIKAVSGNFTATATITVTPAGFTVTGSMNVAREFHTATLLNTGKVLITGGEDATATPLDSAELYDPATGTFSFTGSMNTPRIFHTATLLNNGKVLIVGGSGTTTNDAELYDPATGTFTLTGGSGSFFEEGGSATLLKNGQVLIAGGNNLTSTFTSAFLYDPGTGQFAATGSLNAGREFHTAVLLNNGEVLIVGGENASVTTTSAELYNPATGTFTLTGSLPSAEVFFFGGSTLLNNGMALLSGDSQITSLELYNPATGLFSSTGTFPTGFFFFDNSAALLSNGTVLLAGGDNANDFNAAAIYDPTSATTTLTGQLNVGRVFSTATLLSNGKVLVAGGESLTGSTPDAALDNAELYTPSSLTPANLLSIAVTPVSPAISVGAAEQFVATGTFVGNTTQVLSAVNWTSSAPAIASITNGAGNGGAAFGLSAGSTIITACAGNACGSTTLNVGSSATLTSVTVTPANPTIPKGTTQQFTATGHFSDGSSSTLTNVTWSSGTPAVASINSVGLATGLSAGTSTITAASGGIHGSTVLTVSAPILVSITVTPANTSIAAGLTQQFTATGKFSDGSTQILVANTVGWASTVPATATINTTGLATAVSAGTTKISAISGTIAGSTNLTVTPPGTPEPAIGLNPGSLTFATQLITTSSAAQAITVSNSGTAVLTINSIALTGANPAEFKETNTCPVPPAVLPAGQTCTVQVSFVPLAVGTRTANVTFTDNSGGIPGSTQNIPVSGNATAPAPITTTTQLSYPAGTNVSETATINCPSHTVPCTDPNAHSLKLLVSQVLTPFTLTVTSFEVPLSQADGVCPAGATETTDFDCRFKSTFTLQTEPNGNVIVPQCIPFSNGNCVFYRISNVPPQSSYLGPVFENFSWNNNAFVPSSFYATSNPRLFDDPDAPPFDVNHQFVFDITDFFESNGNKVGVDPTIHGHTKQYNDFVVAFTAALPNPPLTLTFQAPLGSGSPSFPQGATIPVAFTLFQVTNPITDAVTSPNAVSIGLANAAGTRFAALAPDGTAAAFTFNPTAGRYVLSLATQNLPPGAYTLMVNSNLFVQQTTSFAITAAPLAITTASPLTAGTAGIAYSQTLAATGGTPPLTWSVTTGTPPAGLTLSALGVLSGTPSAAVTGDAFTVQVKDSVGVTGTKQFALTIAPPLLVSIAVTPANPSIVIGGTQQFTATGTFSNASTQNLTGSVTWSSATPAAATITTTGLATGVGAGTSVIRATSGNISGTTTLAVTTTVTPEPAIFFKPTSLTFLNQLIGSSSTAQNFTVGNAGTAPLTITGIALTGTNPAEFKETSNCPVGIGTALAAGATCNVQVSFVPLAVGTRTANVTFTDNTGGIPGSQQNVALSGTASAPPPITTTVQLSYPVGTNVSETATINCPSHTVPCTDPNAHSLKLLVSQVLTPFTLTVTSFEVPLSQADGVCPAGATETTDFDCRFKSTFTLQTEPNGNVIVPQCIPFSNGNCVFYRISNVPPTSSYVGPVFENFSWNNNAFVPKPFYAANNPRLFDDPDAPPFDVDHQFVFDITDFFESNGNKVGVDPTIHGHTKQYNDFVVAFTAALPNPPLTLTFQAPLGSGSPSFPQGATIPVAFSLTQGTTIITNAVTAPNAVSIGLANASGARLAALAPDGTPATLTFNTTSQHYGVTLATQALPPGVYTLFVNSDLFVQQSTSFTITAPPPVVTISTPAVNPFTITKGTGTYVVALTVVNSGNVPVGTLSLVKGTLGGQAALSFSGPVSNVMPGARATFTLTFPSTARADGKGVPLTINGQYLAGALSGTWAAGFRSVTLP